MKIYRNDYRAAGGSSAGFSYHGSKRDARRAARDVIERTKDNDEPTAEVETDVLIILPTKAGIIRALNKYAGHNDNG